MVIISGPPQRWYEMPDLRRRWFANSVWIPLRAAETTHNEATFGRPGYSEEVFCAGSVAFAPENRVRAEELGWTDIGLIHNGGPYAFSDGSYKPCEVYQYTDGANLGIDLVFVQQVSGDHPNIWHLSQDLVMALGLLQEGDVWVRPEENYTEVVRQRRGTHGDINAIEIRKEFLQDYLAARGPALRLAYYRQRMAVLDDITHLQWLKDGLFEEQAHDRFHARVFEVGSDGEPFGAGVAVFQTWRNDVDPEEDVPFFGLEGDSNTETRSTNYKRGGPKFYRAEGELWREEWIEPAERSERVRRDEPPELIFFVVDASGAKQHSRALDYEEVGRYLWFDSRAIAALSNRRGGGLRWHTRDIGSVWCSPDWSTPFGVNRLGLINVYAYDIAKLPHWQQKVWAGYNLAPDGGVSAELLEAQMRTQPAETQAPEADLPRVMDELDVIFRRRIGVPLFRAHESTENILRSIHRFRAVDRDGLLALAKDVARLTADRLDIGTLRKIVTPPRGETWRSLKSLEMAMGTMLPPEQARAALTPLVGVYELRLGDAHLPSSEISEAFEMVGVDPTAELVEQGRQLLTSAVGALRVVRDAFASETDIASREPA
jgi:hypothetical protein